MKVGYLSLKVQCVTNKYKAENKNETKKIQYPYYVNKPSRERPTDEIDFTIIIIAIIIRLIF